MSWKHRDDIITQDNLDKVFGPGITLDMVAVRHRYSPSPDGKCMYKKCKLKSRRGGYCEGHFKEMIASGVLKKPVYTPGCIIPGCLRSRVGRGLCNYHYGILLRVATKEETYARHQRYYASIKDTPEHKLKRGEYRKVRNSSVQGRYVQARAAAKRRKIPWDITVDDFETISGGPCEYCGIDSVRKGTWLDRKDNSQGYCAGNVVPCCGNCNKIKNKLLTHSETISIIALLKELRGGRVW